MDRIWLERKQVPESILNWADSRIGGRTNKISLKQGEGEINISMPWHEAAREYHRLFHLDKAGNVIGDGFEITRSGWEGDGNVTGREIGGKSKLAPGYIMVTASTYPKMITIVAGPGSLKMLPEPNDLDVVSKAILVWASNYKSFARPKVSDTTYYDRLIEGGFLRKNRSVTPKGRNAVANWRRYSVEYLTSYTPGVLSPQRIIDAVAKEEAKKEVSV